MKKPIKLFKKRQVSILFNNTTFLNIVSYTYMSLSVKKNLNNIITSKQCDLTLIKNTLLQKTIENTIYKKFSNIFYCSTAIVSSKEKIIYLSEINKIFFDKKNILTTILLIFLNKVYFLSKMKIYLDLEKFYGVNHYLSCIPYFLIKLMFSVK